MASTTNPVKTDAVASPASSSAAPTSPQSQAPDQASQAARAPAASDPPKDAPEKAETPVNFTAYCQYKGIPQRHMPGMLAFTQVKHATLAQWDEIFKAY